MENTAQLLTMINGANEHGSWQPCKCDEVKMVLFCLFVDEKPMYLAGICNVTANEDGDDHPSTSCLDDVGNLHLLEGRSITSAEEALAKLDAVCKTVIDSYDV